MLTPVHPALSISAHAPTLPALAFMGLQIIAGNTNGDAPEEQEWEARKERMAQMEAILMSAINHPNIVRTYKASRLEQAWALPQCLLTAFAEFYTSSMLEWLKGWNLVYCACLPWPPAAPLHCQTAQSFS